MGICPWEENAFLSPCQPWLPCLLQGRLSKQQKDSDRDQNPGVFSICLSFKISLYAQPLKESHNYFCISFPFPTLEMLLALQVSGIERRQRGESWPQQTQGVFWTMCHHAQYIKWAEKGESLKI